MLFVTVLSVNSMISCSALSCVLVGSVEFSPVANYKSTFTGYKKGSVGLNDFYLMM